MKKSALSALIALFLSTMTGASPRLVKIMDGTGASCEAPGAAGSEQPLAYRLSQPAVEIADDTVTIKVSVEFLQCDTEDDRTGWKRVNPFPPQLLTDLRGFRYDRIELLAIGPDGSLLATAPLLADPEEHRLAIRFPFPAARSNTLDVELFLRFLIVPSGDASTKGEPELIAGGSYFLSMELW
ncbi:MAG: hypothetical protein NDJ89_11825 [Oligoflexia bacterium]|nr:hypothetical protein [Oligoflexia bacterium]